MYVQLLRSKRLPPKKGMLWFAKLCYCCAPIVPRLKRTGRAQIKSSNVRSAGPVATPAWQVIAHLNEHINIQPSKADDPLVRLYLPAKALVTNTISLAIQSLQVPLKRLYLPAEALGRR